MLSLSLPHTHRHTHTRFHSHIQVGDEFNKASRPHPSHAIATTNFAISLTVMCVWVYLCEKSQNKCDTQTNNRELAKYISIAADDYYYCSPDSLHFFLHPSLFRNLSPSPFHFPLASFNSHGVVLNRQQQKRERTKGKKATTVNRRRLSSLFRRISHEKRKSSSYMLYTCIFFGTL